jgi:hypothetical protein
MTALISKYIEVMGARLEVSDYTKSRNKIQATMILAGRWVIYGIGDTVQAAMQRLHSELEAKDSQ